MLLKIHKQVYYIVSVTIKMVIVKLHQTNEPIQEHEYDVQRISHFQRVHSVNMITE